MRAERNFYIVGLILLLLVITSFYGVPSAVGTPALVISLVLSWRVGVIIRDYCNEQASSPQRSPRVQ